MSAVLRFGIGASAIALCSIALASAVAQRTTQPGTPGDVKPPPSQTDAVPPYLPTDRAGTQQQDRNRIQPSGTQPGQPYTANFRGAPNAGQSNQAVEQYLTNCVLKHNKAEIELAQFVQQRTQNPEVKQFAAMLEKDHQQLVQKIEQATGMRGGAARNASPELGANASGRDNTTIGATGGRQSNSEFDPGSPATTAEAAANSVTKHADAAAGNRTGMSGNAALDQLAAIEGKILDRCKQAFRTELEQKSGNEFDECYIGSQIGGHMHMLASLEVLSQESQGPLKQLASDARPAVQKHLDDAKQLVAELKGSERNTATARRPGTDAERQQ